MKHFTLNTNLLLFLLSLLLSSGLVSVQSVIAQQSNSQGKAASRGGSVVFQWNGKKTILVELRDGTTTFWHPSAECEPNKPCDFNKRKFDPGDYTVHIFETNSDDKIIYPYQSPIKVTVKDGQTSSITPPVGQLAIHALTDYISLTFYSRRPRDEEDSINVLVAVLSCQRGNHCTFDALAGNYVAKYYDAEGRDRYMNVTIQSGQTTQLRF